MADRRVSPSTSANGHLSPNRDPADVPGLMERGRRGLTGRKGYNEPATSTSPSPSPSARSASSHARSASIGHHGRRPHSTSSPLSPDLGGSRPSSRGDSPRARSRSRGGSGLTGRKGYNGDGVEGRKGYNDGLPSPDPLENVRRHHHHHSRSASQASGSDKHSPSPSRAKFSPEMPVDYSPRPHVGMGGRKGYNHVHGADGRAPQQQQDDEPVGLGINRSDGGLTGRKGYNGAARNPSPAPPRK